MNEIETTAIFTILKVAYPNDFKDMTRQTAEATVSLWQQMFADTPADKVKAAVTMHIANSKWLPKIAEIKDYIAKMSEPNQQSAIDAWQSVRKALQHGEYMQGGYDYSKAFGALPALVKRVVGDKYQLRVYSEMDEQNFEQFERPRFIANYEKQSKVQAEFGRLPGAVQAETVRLSEKNAVPLDGLLLEAKRRAAK
jgi:hypothetical protein